MQNHSLNTTLSTGNNQLHEFYVHMTVQRNKVLCNKTNRRTNFQIYSGMKLYMFRAVPLPIMSYPLYIRHWHMLCRFEESLRAGSGWNWYCMQAVVKPA